METETNEFEPAKLAAMDSDAYRNFVTERILLNNDQATDNYGPALDALKDHCRACKVSGFALIQRAITEASRSQVIPAGPALLVTGEYVNLPFAIVAQ